MLLKCIFEWHKYPELEVNLCEIFLLLIYNLIPPEFKNIKQVLNATDTRHHETFDLAGYSPMPDYLFCISDIDLDGCFDSMQCRRAD